MVAIPTLLSADDYLATDRERPRFTELIHLVGPPDLAVEIRSPSTWRFDVGMKLETYERA